MCFMFAPFIYFDGFPERLCILYLSFSGICFFLCVAVVLYCIFGIFFPIFLSFLPCFCFLFLWPRWSFVGVSMIFSCLADHVPGW